MAAPDELDAQRKMAPVGTRTAGTVAHVPSPRGVIGVFVDLDAPVKGFVDVGELPLAVDEWPEIGDRLEFEVQQHRLGQVRLTPCDQRLRRYPVAEQFRDDHWEELKRRYPVGINADFTVTHVFPANREIIIADGAVESSAEWSGEQPEVGTTITCRVDRHSELTRRLILTAQ